VSRMWSERFDALISTLSYKSRTARRADGPTCRNFPILPDTAGTDYNSGEPADPPRRRMPEIVKFLQKAGEASFYSTRPPPKHHPATERNNRQPARQRRER
jgi:hypothetical protein